MAVSQAQQALPSVQRHVERKVKQMFDFITAQGDADYIGEHVSQLEHSLQCADMAAKANADSEIVLAALLHDVGRFIPAATKMEKMICKDGTNVGIQSHEVLGENYLRELGFSEKICQLVGAHVVAKRYLTAVDQEYYDALSESSKRTLKFQGGPFTEKQVQEAQRDPWLQDKLAVRRWDDQAKVPDVKSTPLSTYEPIAYRELLRTTSQVSVDGKIYCLPSRPTAVISVKGLDSESLEAYMAAGHLPTLSSFAKSGYYAMVRIPLPLSDDKSMPIPNGDHETFHNQANLNLNAMHFHASKILNHMEKSGVRTAYITAQDGLHDLSNNHEETTTSRRTQKHLEPGQDSSASVLARGIRLLCENTADLVYLTITDIVSTQGGSNGSLFNQNLVKLDEQLGQLVDFGADVVLIGDFAVDGVAESGIPILRSKPVVKDASSQKNGFQNSDLFNLVFNW